MIKSVHNWIAIVAVLAVTLLGAVAINRTSSERIRALKESVANVCQNQNIVRQQLNADGQRLARNTAIVRIALVIATRSDGQTQKDSDAYQQLVDTLGPISQRQTLQLIDCSEND